MNKHPYIIMAPPYRHNSGGVRSLYALHEKLMEMGHSSTILQSGKASPDAIVVYPETVTGNPLHGETVVRWVLYYPGVAGGDKQYGPSELIFTHDELFYPGAPVLKLSSTEKIFRNENLERSGGCFYVGKGIDLPRIPETEGLQEITKEWPTSRQDLARLLNTKVDFYTYDNCTALIDEARLCGCNVHIIPGEKEYTDAVNIDKQMEDFIRITQYAANNKERISFGALVNDPIRLDMCLKLSEIKGSMHYIKKPTSATKGLNKLLGIMEDEGADIAVLAHQDMYFRQGWLPQVREQIAKLPDSWVVAGIIGKDLDGEIKGRFHDMRIPLQFDYGPLPCEASCFDECVIIVNLKKGFRFNETLEGFDLYGTLCVLQTWEMGGTAWVIDAFAEHYCMRPFTWRPDKVFESRLKWLFREFPNAKRIDSTVFGVLRKEPEREQVA